MKTLMFAYLRNLLTGQCNKRSVRSHLIEGTLGIYRLNSRRISLENICVAYRKPHIAKFPIKSLSISKNFYTNKNFMDTPESWQYEA